MKPGGGVRVEIEHQVPDDWMEKCLEWMKEESEDEQEEDVEIQEKEEEEPVMNIFI